MHAVHHIICAKHFHTCKVLSEQEHALNLFHVPDVGTPADLADLGMTMCQPSIMSLESGAKIPAMLQATSSSHAVHVAWRHRV